MRLPIADENLIVGIELGFYTTSNASQAAGVTEEVDTSVTSLPLLARAEYQLRLGSFDLMPVVGGGLAFTTASVSSPSTGESRVTSSLMLLSVALAGALPLGPGRLRVELGFWHAPVEETFLRGNLGGYHAGLGYALEL